MNFIPVRFVFALSASTAWIAGLAPLPLHAAGMLPETSVGTGTLRVVNDSPYVVRLATAVQLLPSTATVELPRPHVLPGETVEVPLPAAAKGAATVRLVPATVYGFTVASYDVRLAAH